ncbi:uncharacterized protein LOC135226379 isoform X2 [Macrobrachium nipponense]|uniref:uncharacterized protein LOC135226379 isoform X2 n=1 Tax=Macrobrachium nipponense TaxID=159736 RepID=UPI0030C85CF8
MSRTKLHEAAFRGDAIEVRDLLASGSDVNCKNRFEETPCHLASLKGRVPVIKLLLGSGASVNALNKNGETPLHRAIDSSCKESVEILLAHSADITLRDAKEHTPLHHATIKRKKEIMKILIKVGSDLYNLNKSGNTGAHRAAFNGNDDVLEILLQAGFNVNYENSDGNTLLHLAAREGHVTTVQLLISNNAQLNVCNSNDKTPVLLAAAMGHTNIVVNLLDLGACPYTNTGYSVLHAAAYTNRIHTLKAVVAKFSERDLLSNLWQNLTAEDVASISGSSDSFWCLRKQSLYLERPESHLVSTLKECRSRYEGSGSAFVKRGRVFSVWEQSRLFKSIKDGAAEMHYMDEKGNTILHVALEAGNEVVADMLIETGALVVAQNHKGQTPLDVALNKQKYVNLRKPDLQDSRYDAFLHILLLSVVTQTVGLEVDNNSSQIHFDNSQDTLDRSILGIKLEIIKNFSKLVSSSVLYDPVGSCGRHILPLAITTNNGMLLPLLLASGFPLTTSDSGLGIVQVAWLTPDITTWVVMVVTRAVINQLQSDLDALKIITNVDPHEKSMLDILIRAISNLIKSLWGSKPWEAQFKCPDDVTPTQLYVTASLYGVTLTAWYIWRAGASNFHRTCPFCRCNALEGALSNKCYSTAFRLVVDMDANPFLKNKDREVSINIFPEDMQLLEVMLGKEYRILEKRMEKSKHESEKQKIQQVIILLMVLFLQYKLKQGSEDWKIFLCFILDAHSRIKEEIPSHPSAFWMASLEKILLAEGTENVRLTSSAMYSGMMRNILSYVEKLSRTLKKLDLTNEEDHFCSLLHILHGTFSDPQCPWKENRNSNNFTSQLKFLFQRSLKFACEDEMPLFLHLLISVAEVAVDLVLDELCKTVPLHHAAQNGITSAVVYLLDCGASPTLKDASDILPVQYAFMFGHKATAEILKTTDNNEMPDSNTYLDFHDTYLRLYGLDPSGNVESRYYHVQCKEKLFTDCFKYVENIWKKEGVEKAVNEILVDFQNGEAQEIKASVTALLSELNKRISLKDKRFEGEIQFVGSSEDNVRLYCPDEYDCNLILSNIQAKPDGELEANLVDLDYEKAVACGHQKKLEVRVLREELKEFISGEEFLNRFYLTARESLMEMDPNVGRLKLMMPGIKKTQVGIEIFFLWSGTKYPMLFVNIDFVPTVKAPWPDNLPKPNCSLGSSSLAEIYLNKVDGDEWRLSFGSKETMIMQMLPECKRNVFLACKMILAALKTESWVPLKLKAHFTYWDSRMFSLPSKGGFALKNCFFQELEEVTDVSEWESAQLLTRACSVFERMCILGSPQEASIDCPKPVKAYFGGDTEKASIYSCAPEILHFLRNFDQFLAGTP